jgi:hypothetical protein
MRMLVCYLDYHEAGLYCHLVIHIENLLRPLQLFHFHSWPIYGLFVQWTSRWTAFDKFVGTHKFYAYFSNLYQRAKFDTTRWMTPGRYSDWLRAGRPRVRSSSPGRVKNFLYSKSSRPALRSTQPPIQCVLGLFPRS